jgi:hypothetical protein
MKYIKSLFSILMLLSLCVFTSCEQENEGAIYDANNQGLSFTFNTFEFSAPANNPVISVPVYRAVADEAYTSSITVSTSAPGVTAPSSVSFAAGEQETTIDINLGSELGVGVIATITITLNEADASVGGVAETEISAYKEYVFESLGMGTFQDNWALGGTYSVEIQKAQGFDRYRVIDPYKEGLTNDDGEWENWIAMGTRCPYIEFWETGEGDLILFNNFALGINYEAVASQPIRAYHASSFSGTNPEFSKKLDAKTYQLAPYYYINGLGGWNKTEAEGVIVITLP